MRGRVIRWSLIVAFALALGRMAWVVFGPATTPNYFIGGDVTAMVGPDAEAKQLYLRRMVYLRQRPRHGWLEVVARDSLAVYVNGQLLGSRALSGFPVALLVDPTHDLEIGTNVIAIVARQTSMGRSPVVSVRGAYVLDDGEHSLGPETTWRCSATLERRSGWWFSPEFDDRLWVSPRKQPCRLWGQIEPPPRATSVASTAHWITFPAAEVRSIAARREFTIEGRPASAWLRLTATACYRVAVNGIVVETEESALGTPEAVIPLRRSYDLTRFLQRGRNEVGVLLTSPTGTPSLLADMEVEDSAGRRQWLGTDAQWQVCPGAAPDWLSVDPHRGSPWQSCHVEAGDLDIPPWKPAREFVSLALPFWVTALRLAGQIATMVLIGLATWWVCRIVERLLAARINGDLPRFRPQHLLVPPPSSGGPKGAAAVHLALLLPAVAIGAAILATWDPRVARQDIFQARWILLALASVAVQWIGLFLTATPVCRPFPPVLDKLTPPFAGRTAVLVAVIVVVAFALRVWYVATDALQTDEVTQYLATWGLNDRGFPSIKVEDVAPSYVSTTELVFLVMGAAKCFLRASYAIARYPAVLFGTLTVLLLYVSGRRMFSRPVGLLAAAIGALSPICTQYSDWGRYPGQLHLTSLLTVYLFWLVIDGRRKVDHRALWLTVLAFVVMYLTWEGAGLLAIGMIVAMLVHCRGRLRRIMLDRSVWLALLVAVLAVGLQYAHRTFQQYGRLWYGTGANDIIITPMWLYPAFDPLYYLWDSTWNRDAFVPAVALVVAAVVSVRHPFDRAARYLLLCLFTTAAVMILLLPVKANRYAFFLAPLLVLVCSAGTAAVCRALGKFAARPAEPRSWRRYRQAVIFLSTGAVLALGSGLTVRLVEMKSFATDNFGPDDLRFPNFTGPCQYLVEHLQPGDAVLTSTPQVVDHLVGMFHGAPRQMELATSYFLQTILYVQVTVPDHGTKAINRFRGMPVVTTEENVSDVFARHRHVWYVVAPFFHSEQNTRAVSMTIRDQMQVVYEDFSTMVLLLDNNHRPAAQRFADEKSLDRAKADFLP
jgi:hypothetical protein